MRFKELKYLALVSQIGISMVLPIIGMVIAGNWVDSKLGTSGIFLILFTLMGIYMAFRNLYVLVIRKTDITSSDNKYSYRKKKKDKNE